MYYYYVTSLSLSLFTMRIIESLGAINLRGSPSSASPLLTLREGGCRFGGGRLRGGVRRQAAVRRPDKQNTHTINNNRWQTNIIRRVCDKQAILSHLLLITHL